MHSVFVRLLLNLGERAVTYVGSLDQVDHLLGNIPGMVADAFDRAQNPQNACNNRN